MDATFEADQEHFPTTHARQRASPDEEEDPPSVPAVLTDEQRDRTLVYLDAHLRQYLPQEAAELLGFPTKYITGVCRREIRPSVDFAARVAKCSGIELAAILTGRLIFPRSRGQTDYAANAATCARNSNSTGLKYPRYECRRAWL
ncbi:hypothetical protein QHF89_48820 [Polyangium sorediatum]|uniref:HTH cro/C1-type domain-containing protein n=1 Tax=Polyangium sorediatum TaxID=889274 RepID=A0ABT6PAE3_9BACT|nr:hypothetical protein [Polyangium sorediatum]MDI1437508.1 hypothetical protein [Polyangium sorediatum]